MKRPQEGWEERWESETKTELEWERGRRILLIESERVSLYCCYLIPCIYHVHKDRWDIALFTKMLYPLQLYICSPTTVSIVFICILYHSFDTCFGNVNVCFLMPIKLIWIELISYVHRTSPSPPKAGDWNLLTQYMCHFLFSLQSVCHINITLYCDTKSNIHISNWFRQAIHNHLYFCSSLEMYYYFTLGCRSNDQLTQAHPLRSMSLSPVKVISLNECGIWCRIVHYISMWVHSPCLPSPESVF